MHDYRISGVSSPVNYIGFFKKKHLMKCFLRKYVICLASQLSYTPRCGKEHLFNFVEGCVTASTRLPVEWHSKSKTTEDSFNMIRNAISNLRTSVMMRGIVGNTSRSNPEQRENGHIRFGRQIISPLLSSGKRWVPFSAARQAGQRRL